MIHKCCVCCQSHGLRLNPVVQDSHHSVEWNREAATDTQYNGNRIIKHKSTHLNMVK